MPSLSRRLVSSSSVSPLQLLFPLTSRQLRTILREEGLCFDSWVAVVGVGMLGAFSGGSLLSFTSSFSFTSSILSFTSTLSFSTTPPFTSTPWRTWDCPESCVRDWKHLAIMPGRRSRTGHSKSFTN